MRHGKLGLDLLLYIVLTVGGHGGWEGKSRISAVAHKTRAYDLSSICPGDSTSSGVGRLTGPVFFLSTLVYFRIYRRKE